MGGDYSRGTIISNNPTKGGRLFEEIRYMLLFFFLLSKIYFITLSQLRMTRKYSLSTTIKKRKCDSIEIMLLLCVFSSMQKRMQN